MQSNEIEIIVYTYLFEPSDELADLANKLGYGTCFNPKFCSDERAVSFVKERLTGHLNIYPGKETDKTRIGYSGFAQIVKVDPARKWRLVPCYNVCIGYQKVEYVDISVDANGRVSIISVK